MYIYFHLNFHATYMSVLHQLLARLLKSGRPEDLETANRLIKNTIKEVRHEVAVWAGFAFMP